MKLKSFLIFCMENKVETLNKLYLQLHFTYNSAILILIHKITVNSHKHLLHTTSVQLQSSTAINTFKSMTVVFKKINKHLKVYN